MKIKSFTFNPFQENTYIIYNSKKECLIIDPGCYTNEEEKKLYDFIKNNKLNPIKIINTHCHIDHILGNQFVHKTWKIDLHIHINEIEQLNNSENIAKIYGLDEYKPSPKPTHFIRENQKIQLGSYNFKILFTPGHSPGHICLYNEVDNFIISGDVIFKNSIGRTDLPGGDYNTLMNSITEKILTINESLKIYPGHGPSTILKDEKETNPFLK